MQLDNVTKKIVNSIADDMDLRSSEVEKVIDMFFKGSAEIVRKPERAHIRWPFLGTLEAKRNISQEDLLNEINNDRRKRDAGIQSGSSND